MNTVPNPPIIHNGEDGGLLAGLQLKLIASGPVVSYYIFEACNNGMLQFFVYVYELVHSHGYELALTGRDAAYEA